MKKPWTPDNCPLQVGSVVYDPHTNSDRMVTRRHLSYADNSNNEEKALVSLGGLTYSGKELMDMGFTYYPEWPCTLDELPCYDEVEDEYQPDIVKLAQYVFNGLKESKYAVKGVHYTGDDKASVWQDDIHDKVSGIITELADLFEEDKHDEQ